MAHNDLSVAARIIGKGNVLAADCPSRQILQHVTSRWGTLVLIALADGTLRFAQVRRRVGGISELAGDEAFTLADMAAVVSEKSGKVIPYVSLPVADYAKVLEGFGLPAGFAFVLADSDDQASRGALFDDSHRLSKLIGRATTPMAETVVEALAAV